MAKRRSGHCTLCGTHADILEEEDVFPTWARNEVKSKLAESPLDGQWPGRVVLRACAECNRGLGREFEDPVAPILKPLALGEPLTLDRDQMTLIATWAWLKDIEYILGRPDLWTMQGRIGHTDRSLKLWRGELATLRATRRPPRGYVVRLAIIGSPTNTKAYQSFAPDGWRHEHAGLTSLNGIGLLVIESLRTTRENAARFIEGTRHDTRATLVWPLLRKTAPIGTRTVPLNHAELWRAEHNFHPNSGWGGGWRICVPRGT